MWPDPAAFLSRWREYHIVYHADLACVLTQLAGPLLRRLVREHAIDRFFLIRYTLGGPHLRLRWRVVCDSSTKVAEEALSEMAGRFFETHRSPEPIPAERILRMNRQLGPLSQGDDIDAVYPDNTWFQVPLHLDIERYGGRPYVADSLEFFTVSSVYVMQLLHQGESPRPEWARSVAIGTFLELAFGFARDEADFLHYVGFAVRWMAREHPACVRQGDEVFERNASQLRTAVERRLNCLANPATPGAARLGAAAACLRSRLVALSPDARSSVACSHMHMTANRLGLSNQEEVYLSRLLSRAVESLSRTQPDRWRRLCDGLSNFSRLASNHSLQALADAAVSQFS
jgi:hypothetical protein